MYLEKGNHPVCLMLSDVVDSELFLRFWPMDTDALDVYSPPKPVAPEGSSVCGSRNLSAESCRERCLELAAFGHGGQDGVCFMSSDGDGVRD